MPRSCRFNSAADVHTKIIQDKNESRKERTGLAYDEWESYFGAKMYD